jgi:hypothetical protein
MDFFLLSSLVYAFISIMNRFQWDRFAYIYSSSDTEQRCSDIKGNFDNVVSNSPVDMSYFRQIDSASATNMVVLQAALQAANSYARSLFVKGEVTLKEMNFSHRVLLRKRYR